MNAAWNLTIINFLRMLLIIMYRFINPQTKEIKRMRKLMDLIINEISKNKTINEICEELSANYDLSIKKMITFLNLIIV